MNDKYNVFDLSETHKQSFVKFIGFFRTKQDRLIKEIQYEIEDYKESKYLLIPKIIKKLFSLKDLMYSRDDLKEMLTDLKEKIHKKTEDEINYYLNMSGKITKYNNLIDSCLRSINIP